MKRLVIILIVVILTSGVAFAGEISNEGTKVRGKQAQQVRGLQLKLAKSNSSQVKISHRKHHLDGQGHDGSALSYICGSKIA